MSDSEKYSFEAEWFDKNASLLKQFYLHYYPSDQTIELFDLKSRKTFLRRTTCHGIETDDFYVGATVTVFSRNMKITAFADQATKEKLGSKILKKFMILKPNLIDRMGEVLELATDYNFYVSNIKMCRLSYEDAKQIFKISENELPDVIECVTKGLNVAVELISKDGSSKWQELLTAFEKNSFSNDIYIPEIKVEQFFFSTDHNKKSKVKNSAKMEHCTCCIIKPHAVRAGLTGPIVNDIQKANFVISAIQQFYVDPTNAEEFLEVYKGVLPDYAAMVNELQSGPCIVMEITHNDPSVDVTNEFRKFCGPMDPEMAKELRPNTLRAKYGKTKIQNALHCSDLEEDSLLEPVDGIKPKISRSTARHLRRKKLIAARRELEKNFSSELSNSEGIQLFSLIQNTSESVVNEKILNSKLLFQNSANYVVPKNSKVKTKKQDVSDLLKNKDNNVESELIQRNASFGLDLESNKNTPVKDNKIQTRTAVTSNQNNLISSTVVNSNSIIVPESCNIKTIKMDSQGKSKEQIKAEREAKKVAKAAAKAKAKGKDQVDGEVIIQPIKMEKNKTQDKPKESISSTSIASDTAQSSFSAKQNVINSTLNIKTTNVKLKLDVDKKSDDKPKTEDKSKAELRAERRAKQEAQRAAKAASLVEKQKPVKVLSQKPKEKSPLVSKDESVRKTVVKSEVKENAHEVNLFKHLYINRKNISELINNRNIKLHPVILRLGVQYAEKVIVGSNARCVALLAAVKQLIEDFERPSQADFTRGLETSLQESVNYLNSCRPLAVSMQNALKHLKWRMTTLPSTVPDQEAKLKLATDIDSYIQEQILLADKAISNAIQQKIVDGDVILTYSYSSLIYKILCDAHDAGKKFRVVIIDGRPWLEGKELLRRLVKHGIDCSYMLINALSFIMPQVNKVFLGAHAILANGAVMSRVGTAQVALIANAFNVPVLVACETHKSCERVQTDSIVYNEIGDPDQLVKNTFTSKKSCLSNWKNRKTLNLLNITYDVTPADLVTAVVTEVAILPCTSVPVILRELNHLKINL